MNFKKQVPDWTKNLNIYEVNLRQFTESGKLVDFEKHLPRLKEMGVDILWFMPINPIGIKNRKGSLGSYYSVKDFKGFNPEFGTIDEWKNLVKKIHENKMYVIIDWVANHASWDNVMMTEHPEWFTKDSTGNIIPPVPDWKDVADLNYENKELWKYMIDAMAFWLKETDIDGFRCDVAGMVPIEFWNEARFQLDKVKPGFMLAEDEGFIMHEKAFDMTYSWEFHHLCADIAKGKKKVFELDSLFAREKKKFPADAYRMVFTSNHDENSWNGTSYEKFGDALNAFTAFCYIVPGMPLIYSGQEAGLNKRLKFFDKDPIEWKEHEFAKLYKKLNALKKENHALWNGAYGGELVKIKSSFDESIFAFKRIKENNEILCIFNFSKEKKIVNIPGGEIDGKYFDVFSDTEITLTKNYKFEMNPWGFYIFKK
ncbi:MAG: alpha-amylase [Bacteroidetes bacterium GWF2_35_48]|nr:MAG: alpha-amylase [Bacteroidetes bacterium GWF2_35_48]OFY96582.1 MAG: alpha-amylase [Bacteroidetes bacterium RIFOXYC12_FULL_35_7]